MASKAARTAFADQRAERGLRRLPSRRPSDPKKPRNAASERPWRWARSAALAASRSTSSRKVRPRTGRHAGPRRRRPQTRRRPVRRRCSRMRAQSGSPPRGRRSACPPEGRRRAGRGRRRPSRQGGPARPRRWAGTSRPPRPRPPTRLRSGPSRRSAPALTTNPTFTFGLDAWTCAAARVTKVANGGVLRGVVAEASVDIARDEEGGDAHIRHLVEGVVREAVVAGGERRRGRARESRARRARATLPRRGHRA